VSASRRAIEKETLKDVEGILERLRAVESLRQSSIQHQVLQLDEELGIIERLVRKVEQANEESAYSGERYFTTPRLASSLCLNALIFFLGTGSTGVLLTSAVPGTAPLEMVRAPRAQVMVELIQQFGDIANVSSIHHIIHYETLSLILVTIRNLQSIEKLSARPVSVQNDFPTDDFPKETAERLEIISRCDKYLHAINVKDQLLWTAIQDKKRSDELLAEERRLSQEYAGEVAQWAELSQGLAHQLHRAKEDGKAAHSQNLYLLDLLRKNNIYVS